MAAGGLEPSFGGQGRYCKLKKYLIVCFVLFLFRHSIYCYAVEVDSIENLLSPIMAS